MSAAANLRATLQDRVDGLCLLCLGGFMASLARSGLYWYFLNPKFSALTLTAGSALCLVGLALVLRPRPGKATMMRLMRQAALLGFLSLAATAWGQAAREPSPGAFDPAPAPEASRIPDPEPPAAPRVTKNGTEYLRLNLAELYIMLDKGRKDYPPHFALRAQVLRTPMLDERAVVMLRRTAVVCCLADSLELRFFASGLGETLPGVENGGWIEVFGRIEPLGKEAKALLKLSPGGEGPSLAVPNPKFGITVEAAQTIPAPDFPYLFEFREKEPFAW